ncbi:hypothetical protein [Alkalihalobacillus sp. AL-G]|uniref:hypothetical protein n=1 Tax=Alkalihalobacillus sp. AL-G TaxID=2926399 RepID=UPI00272D34D9|nr:hypothetical protein [Alkalihalobacillus sp. AL-G]WLD94851.1 hypothetical protein MOJ78_08210 [Alkalihalobacillus sp. AL-G]
MKNILFGLFTLTVLTGISYILISPGFTDFFIGEPKLSEQESTTEIPPSPYDPLNPEELLQQTGIEWAVLSDRQKLEFTAHILSAMKTRDISVSKSPSEFINEIDEYYTKEPTEHTIENAIMRILAEDWSNNEDTD